MQFNEIINIGEEFRIYSAVLCLATVIYLIFKKPAGILFIGSIINSGLGSTFVFFNSFAIIVVFLQLITIVKLLKLFQVQKMNFQLPRISKLYIILLIILILKVIFHISFSVSEDDLFIYLEIGKTFVFTVVFPTLIFYLSVHVYGIRNVSRDILFGTLFLGLSVLIPFILPLLSTGYLADGLSGSVRVKMYSEDTINGSRIFYLISTIAILALLFKLDIQIKKIHLIIIFLFTFLLVILSGTRQFIFPLAAIWLYKNNFIKNLTTKIILAVIIIVLFSNLNFTDNEALSKFSKAAFKEEATDSRGLIWSLGFTQMLNQSPFLGLGYSNFGDGFSYDRNNSENKSYVRNMTPHGFLQSVFIEQGVPLGLSFLLIIIIIITIKKNYFSPFQSALFILIVSFNWAESFSGDIENSLSFYLLPFILTRSRDD